MYRSFLSIGILKTSAISKSFGSIALRPLRVFRYSTGMTTSVLI
jgi:hypothetical protein